MIDNATEWAPMWERLIATRPVNPPPLPSIDFDSNQVIVTASGRGYSGTSIRIDSVRTGGSTRTVYVMESRSGVNCTGPLNLTYPAHVIQVRRTGKPVRFVDRSRITSQCR